jgi:lipoic acid synthetase
MVESILGQEGLHTVCREAHCPNRGECHGRGEATFLLLGPDCTRACAFCAVSHKKPSAPDAGEAVRVARAAQDLGLKFVVLTMVSRDDLVDGGAAQVAAALQAIKKRLPDVGQEVLISDLGGNPHALEVVLEAEPQVLNHNLETVPRLYPAVRPQADYQRSLQVLVRAARHRPRLITKSGLMLGLGEEPSEVAEVLTDLRKVGCQALTLGQYLAPSRRHHPVARYVPPEEFDRYARMAREMGFSAVACGPLVRSSYRAGELWAQARQALSAGD